MRTVDRHHRIVLLTACPVLPHRRCLPGPVIGAANRFPLPPHPSNFSIEPLSSCLEQKCIISVYDASRDSAWSRGLKRESPPQSAWWQSCRLCRRARSCPGTGFWADRKSTRLNSSHLVISYAVFCLKKKKKDSAR